MKPLSSRMWLALGLAASLISALTLTTAWRLLVPQIQEVTWDMSPKEIQKLATEIAEREVLEVLVSPSTCVFAKDKYRYESKGWHHYVLVGVDSQNSFSAMVRSYFVVDLHESGGRLIPSATRRLNQFTTGSLSELASATVTNLKGE